MMKNLLSLILVIILYSSSLHAQLPQNPNEISPLLYGEKIPGVTVYSPDSEKIKITSLISEKPSVLLFYRGGWCPFCNRHLAEIQKVQKEINDLGYQILAISPDSPQSLQKTSESEILHYRLLSDWQGELIKAIGIAFQSPERYSNLLNKSSDGMNKGFLPVPAVFVTDTAGIILFEYINPDYKTRITSDLLISVLKAL